jgi:ABC-2 type transport system permease protein
MSHTSTFARTPTVSFRAVVRAEITKILTHPVTTVSLLLTFVANTSLGIVGATDVIRLGTGAVTVPLTEVGVVMFAPVYLFIITAVYASGSEYHGGQIKLTLAAVPARPRLVLAKLVALVSVITPAALIALTPVRGLLTIPDDGTLSLVLADLTRWVVVYLLMSLIGFGLAGITRSTVTPLAILLLLPILIATGVFQWPALIRFLPDQAAMSMLGTPVWETTSLPPTSATLALTTWAFLTTVAFTHSLNRRDT